MIRIALRTVPEKDSNELLHVSPSVHVFVVYRSGTCRRLGSGQSSCPDHGAQRASFNRSPQTRLMSSPPKVSHMTFDRSLVTYGRINSDLNYVSSTSFVGITSAKEANGTEVAKEIHIFPAELRGAGEGSNLIDAPVGSQVRAE
jgi:hypothetical protein